MCVGGGSKDRRDWTAEVGVSIGPLDSGEGVEIVDPIERHRYVLRAADAVSPEPVPTDTFRYPVDTAVRFRTSAITLPSVVAVYVRDRTGAVVAEAEHFAHRDVPADRYSIELCAPIKLYLRVESSVLVASDTERTVIEFGEAVDVHLGARSHHRRPAGTITTTDEPVDVMAAVSTFGSALKTTSCERSYPTLRGHPPLVELGDELAIPAGLSPPETGVEIRIPPTYRSIFVAAPLAYYLGARLVPDDRAALVTATGFEHALEGPLGFEREVERVLKQVFFLDCITRTEGFYPVSLHEREAIEPVVGLDFAALYDAPLAEQLEAYLSIPYEAIEAHVPEWKLTSHVVPTATSVETLPFVVDDLAVVRTPRTETVSQSDLAVAVDDFLRDDEFTRSAAEAPQPVASYVQPETAGSLEHAWIGEETPVGASKATADAYRNHLARTPGEGDITITVVCNDGQMADEQSAVDEVYGSRAELPFDVEIHRDLTIADLREVLGRETDFLHYIGHIDAQGFQCADGAFDAGDLEATGVDAFLLNACQSYEQGLRLIEAGAIGGVVTLNDVINSGAVRIGEAMARLLNGGFPLQAALNVAGGESIVGSQYIVVGDGGLAVTQSENGIPNLCEVKTLDEAYEVTYKTFPTSQRGMGNIVMPYLDESRTFGLSAGNRTFVVSKAELAEFLRLENVPVRIDGELQWSGDLSFEIFMDH